MKKTASHIRNMKGKEQIVTLTAYTTPMASILDEHVDILLVGDSLGMVLYGMESTLPVTMDMMCEHGKAVVRASNNACVVVDMPFGSYQKSKKQAFENAAKIMAYTGCNAVKLEGGEHMKKTIKFLVERGIPVMAHVGLMPQSFNTSGYKKLGSEQEESEKIINDAIAVEKAGAFAVVLENIAPDLGEEITNQLSIPTIGIGAGNCDGQVLVTEDMLGLFGDKVPGFVKLYGDLQKSIAESISNFAGDVKSGEFLKK